MHRFEPFHQPAMPTWTPPLWLPGSLCPGLHTVTCTCIISIYALCAFNVLFEFIHSTSNCNVSVAWECISTPHSYVSTANSALTLSPIVISTVIPSCGLKHNSHLWVKSSQSYHSLDMHSAPWEVYHMSQQFCKHWYTDTRDYIATQDNRLVPDVQEMKLSSYDFYPLVVVVEYSVVFFTMCSCALFPYMQGLAIANQDNTELVIELREG